MHLKLRDQQPKTSPHIYGLAISNLIDSYIKSYGNQNQNTTTDTYTHTQKKKQSKYNTKESSNHKRRKQMKEEEKPTITFQNN